MSFIFLLSISVFENMSYYVNQPKIIIKIAHRVDFFFLLFSGKAEILKTDLET